VGAPHGLHKIREIYVRNKILILLGTITICNAEEIKSMVEFFSYRCSHCANVNVKLGNYVAQNQVNFIAVNVDNNDIALPTNIMYSIAVDAGVGENFRNTYFQAVATGYTAYAANTLNYVVNQVKTTKFEKLVKDPNEKTKVKQKLAIASQLLSKYQIQSTPTFLINDLSIITGEDFVNYLN